MTLLVLTKLAMYSLLFGWAGLTFVVMISDTIKGD